MTTRSRSIPAAVRLRTLAPGDRFTVDAGYLAPGGSSDAGILTVRGPSVANGRVDTTDGRQLHAGMLVRRVGEHS